MASYSEPDARIPLLKLPELYDIPVYDVVHFALNNKGSTDTTTATTEEKGETFVCEDITMGAGVLLVSKIIDGILCAEGARYTNDEVRKVGRLVERNLYTCHSAQVEGDMAKTVAGMGEAHMDDKEAVGRKVDFMLQGLLDRDVPIRDANVHVNSNEPVLLINMHQNEPGHMNSAQQDLMNHIVDASMAALQQKWNIWPVRVYAGAVLPRWNKAQTADNIAFSITLLNVVNTDIGGPSMPQLLDVSCSAIEWDRIARMEIWRGRDLVSRDDRSVMNEDDNTNASEHSIGSHDDDNESVGSDALSPAILQETTPHDASNKPERDDVAEHDEQQALLNVPEEREQLPTKPEDLQLPGAASQGDRDTGEGQVQEQFSSSPEFELPERHIEHPTWVRQDDSMSLLDLIRSQASIIAPFGTESSGHGVADVEEKVAEPDASKATSPSSSEDVGAASDPAKDESPGDDEFVVL